MKFTLDKNKLEININKPPRTKAQRMILNKMISQNDLSSAVSYLGSFATKRHRNYVNRIQSVGPEDSLIKKSPNTILSTFNKILNSNISHVPWNNNQKFLGVEIECFIPYASLDIKIKTNNCNSCEGSGTFSNEDSNGDEFEDTCHNCEGSGHDENDQEEDAHESLRDLFRTNHITRTTIKSDGSIRPDSGYFAVEITVLTRLDSSENLRRVCTLLKTLNTKVNKSCGMHIHLDMRHKNLVEVINIGKNFNKVLPVLGSMVPKTRRNNEFCRLVVSRTERYSAVNLKAFSKFKTIEVRLHSSTTDFDKIMNWAILLNSIASTNIKKQCNELNDLTEYVYLSENLLEYFSQRIAMFSNVPETINALAMDSDSTELAA